MVEPARKIGPSIVERRRKAAERLCGLFAHVAPGASLADDLIADRRAEVLAEANTEPRSETVPLPEDWDRMANGEPMPDVAAAVRRSRAGH